jgi:hypothetical protein
VAAAVMVSLGSLLASCGNGVDDHGSTPTATAVTTTTEANLGGDGLPVRVPGKDYGHHPTALTGTLVLEPSGCWTVDLGDFPRIVMFPEGFTRLELDGSVMVSPDGSTFLPWMAVDARGGIVAAGSLPGVPDGFWGNYLAYCASPSDQVVVLDSVVPAFDPATLGNDELVAMMEEAELTVSWGCGFGFQASNEQQTVALSLWLEGADATGPVTLPDATWISEVRVGKNLMANNCDDVIEGWEPFSGEVAAWPLSAGRLEFDPLPGQGCAGVSVSATLTGAMVATPGGDVAIDDLTIVNESYGCLAG